MPDIVPGRMVLLVTTLLSLVTMFDTVSNNSPDALELKCIEVSAVLFTAITNGQSANLIFLIEFGCLLRVLQVWLISCTLFVFLALMEYFIVLFGIRYDKHWRTVKSHKTISAAAAVKVSSPNRLQPPTLPPQGSSSGSTSTVQINNEAPVRVDLLLTALDFYQLLFVCLLVRVAVDHWHLFDSVSPQRSF